MVLVFDPDMDGARPWRTIDEHIYKDGQIRVEVPRGFATDLASVPSWLLWLYDPGGRHQRAALFHDWLYSDDSVSRFDADAIFRIILRRDGVSKFRTFWLYLAVRVFGGFARKRKGSL